MALTFKLSDGTTEINLIYDASSNSAYSLQSAEMVLPMPDVLMHMPDSGAPVPVRSNDTNREFRIKFWLTGTDEDDTQNKLAAIKRWVDGSHSQALRAQTVGDVDPIYLQVQRPNGTSWTRHEVLYGLVDDGATYFDDQMISGELRDIEVTLMLAPLGYGSADTYNNALASSPHFLEDSNADGLADGLVLSGSPTVSIATLQYLTGGRSQRFDVGAGATSDGFRTNSITASASTEAVAYIWISASSNSDVVRILLSDGSNNTIDSVLFTPSAPAGYDKSVTADGGNVFYRYVLSGTNSTAADFRIFVQRLAGAAVNGGTYYIDNMYLQTGTTTAPAAFMSTATWVNRYRTDLATGNINYIDLWGVPGDAPALVDFESGLAPNRSLALFSWDSGKYEPNAVTHFIEDNQILPASGNWSSGSPRRWTPPGASSTEETSASFNTTASQYFINFPVQVYAVAQVSTTDNEFRLIYGTNQTTVRGEYVTCTATGVFELVNMGIMDLRGIIAPEDTAPNVRIGFGVSGSSGYIDLDFFFFLPVGQSLVTEKILTDSDDIYSYGGRVYTDSEAYSAFGSTAKTRIQYVGTGITEIKPGQEMTRFCFLSFGSSSNDFIYSTSDTETASFIVTPRTRHLLGTA